jgi:hypothetical protein
MAKLNILLSNDNSFRDKDEVLKDLLRQMFDQETDPFKLDEIIMIAGHWGFYQLSVEMQKDLNSDSCYRPVIVHTLTAAREKEVVNG